MDGTDFRRREPFPFCDGVNSKWFTHKFKSAGFRYEVGTNIKIGNICWFNGPFPCGMMNDLRIFRLKLKTLLRPEEKVLADRGYRGDSKILTEDDAKNKKHRRSIALISARHETVNRRLKQWNSLNEVWRNEDNKHGIVFRSIITITELEIRYGRPLFHVNGYEDQVLGSLKM